MNIQAEKIELLKLLSNTDNPKTIQAIKQIFEKENATDLWDELTAEQKAEIKQATSEIESGNVTDYNSFMANHK
ncbi:hypothetical protein H2O64_21390 [Kordia sp. YSTF-M3]|uniref:Addiction module component n=1 Tax=Kordia aestuariivivens TaxID=2759037 RepID=A0ABR7QFP9_9FLAO|nr:hypothetical protein [Kordia aestuariivivens]MBC8757238.1 hypothetical protein [Kordia aestuariivivens]